MSRAGRVQISLKIVARIREGCSLASIERAARMILWTGTAEGHSLVQAWQSIHLEKCAAASGQGL
ncbi:MAG TPA: hypothetical protein PKX93_12565, partial [bacterium]|nr:hypothetical protein [bacterium]